MVLLLSFLPISVTTVSWVRVDLLVSFVITSFHRSQLISYSSLLQLCTFVILSTDTPFSGLWYNVLLLHPFAVCLLGSLAFTLCFLLFRYRLFDYLIIRSFVLIMVMGGKEIFIQQNSARFSQRKNGMIHVFIISKKNPPKRHPRYRILQCSIYL